MNNFLLILCILINVYIINAADDCTEWNEWSATDAPDADYVDIDSSSTGEYLVAVVDNGDYIYISSDYGNTWVAKSTEAPSQDWTCVTMSSTG